MKEKFYTVDFEGFKAELPVLRIDRLFQSARRQRAHRALRQTFGGKTEGL